MKRGKKGTSLPKKGTIVHPAAPDSRTLYRQEVAKALQEELGATRNAVKSAMRWTGASERTVKYWFAGLRGPSGEHLIALVCQSDAILEMVLRRAGRRDVEGALRLLQARETLFGTTAVMMDALDRRAGPSLPIREQMVAIWICMRGEPCGRPFQACGDRFGLSPHKARRNGEDRALMTAWPLYSIVNRIW